MGVNVVKNSVSGASQSDLGFLSRILSFLTILASDGLILEVRQNVCVFCLDTESLGRRGHVGFGERKLISRSWLIGGIFNDIHTIFLFGVTQLFESFVRRISDLSLGRLQLEGLFGLVDQIWSDLGDDGGRDWVLGLLALDLRGLRSKLKHVWDWVVVFCLTVKSQ